MYMYNKKTLICGTHTTVAEIADVYDYHRYNTYRTKQATDVIHNFLFQFSIQCPCHTPQL